MIDLTQYGYPRELIDPPDGMPARVVAAHRGAVEVICPEGQVWAKLKGSAVREGESYPAVGDYVVMRYNPSGESLITRVLERRSKFARSDYSGHAAGYVKTIREQVVAANFDWVLIMASLNYDLNVRRIERYIAQARESGGKPCVVLTKSDLVEDYQKQLSRSALLGDTSRACSE